MFYLLGLGQFMRIHTGSDAVIFLHKSGKLVDLVNGQDDE